MTESSTALSDLLTQLRSFEVVVPAEVTAFIQDHIRQSNVQYVKQMQATSELTRRSLVRHLVAAANSGQLLEQSPGFVIFSMTDARLQRPHSVEVLDANRASDFDIQNLLSEVISSMTSPSGGVDCRFFRTSDACGYTEVRLAKSTPVYFHDPDEPIPFIPVWRQEATGWSVEPASSEEITNLYQIQLNGAFGDRPYSKRNEINQVFDKHKLQSGTDFAGFLTSLLLRPNIEDRVLSARLLVRIGGIDGEVKRLIAQLLTALLHDEPEVAVQAARSLEEVGSEDQVSLLMQSINRYSHNRDVLLPVLTCIGELGSAETIKDVIALYSGSSDESVKQAIDSTIVRLYKRHDLPLFDPVHRERFMSQIDAFQYALARNTVSKHGADLCLPFAHRETVLALTQYAHLRLKGQRHEAFNQLSQLAEKHLISTDTLLGQIINRWLGDRRILVEAKPEDMVTPPEILAELFFQADIEYLNRNPGGFITILYNLVDQLSGHLLIRNGIVLRRSEMYVYLDKIGNENNPTVADFIKAQKHPASIKVDRKSTKAILEKSPNDVAQQAHQLLLSFEELIRLRHRLPTAHGHEASNEELFVHAYGADFPTIIGDVRRFFKMATGYELGTNPFVELNSDIRYTLTSADSMEPNAKDLLARKFDTPEDIHG